MYTGESGFECWVIVTKNVGLTVVECAEKKHSKTVSMLTTFQDRSGDLFQWNVEAAVADKQSDAGLGNLRSGTYASL